MGGASMAKLMKSSHLADFRSAGVAANGRQQFFLAHRPAVMLGYKDVMVVAFDQVGSALRQIAF